MVVENIFPVRFPNRFRNCFVNSISFGDAEIGMQMGRVRLAVHARAMHGQIPSRGQRHRGKLPALELFGLVGQRPAGKVHRA